MGMISASAYLYETFKEMNLKSDPTVVLAFDDYETMYRFWTQLMDEHKHQLFVDWSVRSLKENQTFTLHGVKYIMRLKLKE